MPLSRLGLKKPHVAGGERPAARGPDKTPSSAPVHAPPDSYQPIGLPITTLNAELSLHGSQVQVGKHAPPRPVLAMEEIRLAPSDQRCILTRRFAASLAFIAGNRLGATKVSSPAEGAVKAGPWSLTSKNGEVTVSHSGGQSVTLNASTSIIKTAERERVRETLVDAFSHLLGKTGDPAAEKVVASSYVFLLGASGVLNMQNRPKPMRESMATPKLVAWDFNGTVQADNGRFRPGMAATAEALKRLGAMNVLTTSISAEPAEEAMDKANIHFDAHFGNAEVRPNSGSKQYEGVAGLFGLDTDASRDVMVTIGDSTTDISGDRAAGLFIHDRKMMPGPAIEQLLLELDRLGNGSFLKGLEAALGGRSLDKPQTLQLGSVKFDVGLRPGNGDKGGRAVPVIDDIEIQLDAREVADILGGKIADVVEDSSQYRLAYEHLAVTLDEQQVPGVLRGVKGDTTAVREAVERRLAERQEDVEVGRKQAGELKGWLAGPVDFDSAAGQLVELARLGDPEVSKAVQSAVRSFAADSAKAQGAVLTALSSQTRTLDKLLSPSSVIDPSAQLTRADVKLINRVLDKPVTLFTRHEDVVKAFSKLSDDDPQVAQLKRQLKAALPDVAAAYEKSLLELFEERKARAHELLPIDGMASAAATVRPAAFRDIRDALAAL